MKLLQTQTKVIDDISFSVTPIQDDKGDLYFLPKEIGEVLEYKDLPISLTTSEGFLENIDYTIIKGDKLAELKHIGKLGNTKFAPNLNSITLLTESGLYAVLLKSRKPLAQKFRIWVTSEVLPSIRRTGSYEILPIPQDKLSSDPFYVSTQQSIMALQRAMQLKYQQDKLKEEQERQKKELEKQEQRQAFQGLELVRQQKQLKELKESVEYQEDSMNYYTVAAYSSNLGLKLNLKQLNRCGRLAAKLSRRLNYKFFKIPHDKFGTVNKYHVEVLEEVFDLINPTNNQEYFDF